MTECGEVVCSGTGRYQWIIDDFHSTDIFYYTSPLFSYLGNDHLIEINNVDEKKLALTFYSYDGHCERLHVTLGMKTGGDGRRENRCGETDKFGDFGVADWMHMSDFVQRLSEILCDGKLTFFCDLRRLDADGSPASLQETPPILEKLQSDFKNILDSGEDCDVTIKVEGKEFLAHSIILRARSPVFKSMFSHEMVEKLSGVVVIEDCDPATFPDLLNYLYTRSTRHVSDENVCHLYIASDKYHVEELKEECAAYMKKHLSVENFCDILTLALRHSERELIYLSAEFFCANATEIAETATWQTFLRENPTTGNELFLKYLKNEFT